MNPTHLTVSDWSDSRASANLLGVLRDSVYRLSHEVGILSIRSAPARHLTFSLRFAVARARAKSAGSLKDSVEWNEAVARRAARRARCRRRLGGACRQLQRKAGHDGYRAPVRTHDVQGDTHDR